MKSDPKNPKHRAPQPAPTPKSPCRCAELTNIIGDMLDGASQNGRTTVEGPPASSYTVDGITGFIDIGEMPRTVPDLLREAADTFEQRNALYGDSYKGFAAVMQALYPSGLFLVEEDDWNRAGVFFMMVSKMMRYGANFATGGHSDSAHDLIVYSAMLEELTKEGKA